MLDSKSNTVIAKKSKTINKGKIHKNLKNNKKKPKNRYFKGGGRIINIKKRPNIKSKRTKKIKNTRKMNRNNYNNNLTRKKFKQSGGTATTTTIYNRNVEPTTPLRDYLRFGDLLDQNVDKMDLGSRWPGKPPYPPDCCIM